MVVSFLSTKANYSPLPRRSPTQRAEPLESSQALLRRTIAMAETRRPRASGTFPAERAQELFEQGFGCNAIARSLGVGPASVSRWAAAAGLKFDRSQTALAVRAHVIDLAEARTLLAQKLMVIAQELADSVDQPYTVYAFGGKDNVYNSHELERPPVEAVRNIVTTAGIAFDKATKVIETSPEGLAESLSVLDRLERDLDGEFDPAADAEFTVPQ